MASKSSKYIARDQSFFVRITGLKPLTTHYVYFENNLVAAENIKPFNSYQSSTWGQPQTLGTPVVTTENGWCSFVYYFNGGTVLDTTPFEQAQNLATKLVSAKQITVADKSTATLPADYQSTYLSYATVTIGVNVTTEETTASVAAIYKTVEVPWDGPPAYVYEQPPVVNYDDSNWSRGGGRGDSGV